MKLKLHPWARTVVLAFSVLAGSSAGAEDMVRAKISTSYGDIIVELDREKAPASVSNFLEYATAGHFDRSLVHRVVPGYAIQGGGYSRTFIERATRAPIAYEGDNGLNNLRGTIAMARNTDPQSATSQWFINLKDNEKLDHLVNDLGIRYGYTVFGRVVEGMEVADQIGAVETGPGGPFDEEVPIEPVIVNRVDPIDY